MSSLESNSEVEIAASSHSPVRRVALAWEGAEVIRPELEEAGFEIVPPSEAQAVVTYGGDGSLLRADRDFPHLPKLPIRRNSDYIKCDRHQNAEVFRRVYEGRQTVAHLPRLRADAAGQAVHAINDIVFHNELATSAVRYRVRIDGKPYSQEIVGDGCVVATPFGSSAYYRSITKSVFRVGIGLAFNNSTEAVNHLVLKHGSVIEVEVTRGPALLFGDNAREQVPVEAGDKLSIRCCEDTAEVWELSTLTCKQCQVRSTGAPAGHRHV